MLDSIVTSELWLAMAIAAAAGLMRGFAGFGSGMLMAPIFAIQFGPVETVVIIILLEIAASAQLIPRVRGEIDWRFVGPMGAAAALLMPLGALLLGGLDRDVMTRAMAAIVLVFVVVLATGWRYEGPKPLPATLGVGALSGVLVTATSMGNPPVMLYMMASTDTAAANRANIIAYFAVTQVAALIVLFATGLLSGAAALRALLLAPAFLFAAWLGSRLFRRSSEALYRRTALVFLFGVAVYGLLR